MRGRARVHVRQGKFDRFIEMYNQERPHQVLDMKYPSELYVSSSRPYRGIGDLVSLPRSHYHSHQLRAHLHRAAKDQSGTVTGAENPFGAKVSTMSPV